MEEIYSTGSVTTLHKLLETLKNAKKINNEIRLNLVWSIKEAISSSVWIPQQMT